MTIEQKISVLSNLLSVTEVVPPHLRDKVEGILLGVAIAGEEAARQTQDN